MTSGCNVIHLFQSTLRRTERLIVPSLSDVRLYFNPRSDERSDESFKWIPEDLQISIHAPTNGATIFYDVIDYIITFQSTLRRTERREFANGCVLSEYFNPRSDERSDKPPLLQSNYCSISIHAPTNGATAILHKKMKKTIQNRLIILLFSTNSLRLLCSCTQYSFFLFIFHGANDLVILCSLSFRTTSKN